ncbi:hypothetical protein UlMin_000901 [Ulmus minor]
MFRIGHVSLLLGLLLFILYTFLVLGILYYSTCTPMFCVRNCLFMEKESIDSVALSDDDDNIIAEDKLKSQCKKCGAQYLASSKYGTGNMRRHIKVCKRNDTRDIGQMMISRDTNSLSLGSIQYDSNKFRELVMVCIVMHDLPFQFVEWAGIKAIHQYLYPDVDTLTRNTAKADVLKAYQREKLKIKAMFEEVSGRVSLTSDLWSSCISDGYMCLTAHFIDKEWRLQKRILNFCFMPPPHTGVALSEKIFDLLCGWKIEGKLFSLTLDNASSNDVSVEALGSQLQLKGLLPCNGEFFHLRCCCHILNLVVQDGLKHIDRAIEKIRESVKYVKGSHSQVRKQKFLDCVKLVSVGVKKRLRQDILTRWNSTYLMLDSALLYRRAFEHLALSDSNYKSCPSAEEWDKVEKVWRFLKVFYDATLVFSGTKYPTANLFFPSISQCYLTLKMALEGTDEYLRFMASMMWVKFQKYWADFSVILAIACILDPRYKMTFVKLCYKKAHGEDSLEILVVRNKLYSLFDEYKSKSSHPTTTSVSSRANEATSHLESMKVESNLDLFKEFDDITSEEFSYAHKYQLELYLDEPKMSRNVNFDVLTFWKSHQYHYPELAAMARDVLSIPVSTVASEAAFSVGGRVLDQYRSSLKPENVEAIICTRDWLYGDKDDNEYENTRELMKITQDIMQMSLNEETGEQTTVCSNF